MDVGYKKSGEILTCKFIRADLSCNLIVLNNFLKYSNSERVTSSF